MSLTSGILIALHLCAPLVPNPPPPDRVAVRVNLVFDHSITSSTIKAATRTEAVAVWKPYGVHLLFDDSATPPALSLDVRVERDRLHVEALTRVLGNTIISPPSEPLAPIRLSYDAVESLVERRHAANPAMHDFVLAVALGRVLAHEIGHVLLGLPSYHDLDGLMRTTFLPDELARPDRSLFLLSPRSVARLRARVAALTDAVTSDHCSPPSP